MQFSSGGFFPYHQEKRHNKLFFFFLTNASGREKWGWVRYFSFMRV